ncbi:NLP/P60 protein [Fictibacillus macauensis ZFHKF-1]|uniref:NLP/P60 protein n=1 Tax=Fictibacillus macauensis ZFHKF-1 TaxID=1196324 RepID=I8AEP8_9BACL|nr:C40 family peptidase [Fictibacillus macauensis]EIT83814.1 NLP/P60 protein [Fictibacillus macauensis ZFHKF-1]
MKKMIAASILSVSLIGGVVAPTTFASNDVKQSKQTYGADQALAESMKNLGKKFKMGGQSPAGFDASGFVRYAYKKGAKLTLPRTIATQYKAGKFVKLTAMKKGDVVFFDLVGKKKPTFVGIYAGDGKVVAATMKGVRTFTMKSGYWKNKAIAAKRFVK